MTFNSYDNFIKFLEGNFFDIKKYRSIQKKAEPYLRILLEKCPARDEWSFNKWISAEGSIYKTNNKSLNAFIENIVIFWINELAKGKKNEKSKNEDNRTTK